MVTVDAPASLAGVAARIRGMDPEITARALAQAGLVMPPAINITLVDDADVASPNAPSWVVGQAFGVDTIRIFPQRIGAYPYESLDTVVVHEIAHLALSHRARGAPLPRWFHEGVAVSVESGWGLGSQMRLLLAAQRHPRIDDVARLFESEALPGTTTAYLLSAALVEDIRRRHGAAMAGDVASFVGSGVPFERAFLLRTGETPDEAAAHAWRMYNRLRWLPALTSASGLWTGILALSVVAFVVRLRRRYQQRRSWEAEEHSDILPNQF